jgi:ribosomal-protein-serine acetyltransferase
MPGVRLRLLEESDADAMYAVVERDRDYLARWMPWAETETLEDVREFIRLTRHRLADNNGLQTAIEVDGELAGSVGMVALVWKDRTATLGYWLAAEHQGRGIVTAAVRAYADYAFGTLGLNRVEIMAGVNNARSRAVAERAGFVQEGVMRDGELLPTGFHDLVVYSQLAAEWRAGRG